MTEHKMWAVVDEDGNVRSAGYTEQSARHRAANGLSVSWEYVERHLNWRVRPCTVIVHDEDGEG